MIGLVVLHGVRLVRISEGGMPSGQPAGRRRYFAGSSLFPFLGEISVLKAST
jgi:hypothetical protein